MITANATVTLYRYNEETDSYARKIFRGVSVHARTKTQFSDRGDGFVDASACTVRIETDRALGISTDDYVFVGVGGAVPDKARCFKVMSFVDNRRGAALGHWRIECGE